MVTQYVETPCLDRLLLIHQVAVTVVLVCDEPDNEWEVALWHNTPESWEWTQTDLEKKGDGAQDVSLYSAFQNIY
jgi:hypothetical protein